MLRGLSDSHEVVFRACTYAINLVSTFDGCCQSTRRDFKPPADLLASHQSCKLRITSPPPKAAAASHLDCQPAAVVGGLTTPQTLSVFLCGCSHKRLNLCSSSSSRPGRSTALSSTWGQKARRVCNLWAALQSVREKVLPVDEPPRPQVSAVGMRSLKDTVRVACIPRRSWSGTPDSTSDRHSCELGLPCPVLQ